MQLLCVVMFDWSNNDYFRSKLLTRHSPFTGCSFVGCLITDAATLTYLFHIVEGTLTGQYPEKNYEANFILDQYFVILDVWLLNMCLRYLTFLQEAGVCITSHSCN